MLICLNKVVSDILGKWSQERDTMQEFSRITFPKSEYYVIFLLITKWNI